MKNEYLKHVEERKSEGLPPLALNAKQTKAVIDHLIDGDDDSFYLDLLTHRVPPGVDEAAYVKASFLNSVATGKQKCSAIDKKQATFLLGTMLGGYNIEPLIGLLDNEDTAEIACDALSNTLLIYDAYQSVLDKSSTNEYAKKVVDNWSNATWFTSKKPLPKEIKLTVFSVSLEEIEGIIISLSIW